jgi:hypothetical protein
VECASPLACGCPLVRGDDRDLPRQPAAGGTAAENAVTGDGGPRPESGRAYQVFNASGTDDPGQRLFLVVSAPDATVTDSTVAAAIGDIATRMTALRSVVDGTDVATFQQVLLPSSMRLLGEWNWWMPGALSWIPRLTIEGELEEPA